MELRAGVLHARPKAGKQGPCALQRSWRTLKSWENLGPIHVPFVRGAADLVRRRELAVQFAAMRCGPVHLPHVEHVCPPSLSS
eukprot:787797-Pyramimonas_sp.AAC.1